MLLWFALIMAENEVVSELRRVSAQLETVEGQIAEVARVIENRPEQKELEYLRQKELALRQEKHDLRQRQERLEIAREASAVGEPW